MELDLEDINKRLDEFDKEHKPFKQFQTIGDEDYVVEFPKGPTTSYYCTPKTKLKYSLFIGRWQNWHDGHQWLIDQQFQKGNNVWVAIRDVPKDENNPYSAEEVKNNLNLQLKDYIKTGKLYISIIPDIESVNYGRGVGYDVIYHEPPEDIAKISGTKIRNNATDKSTTM
jgi:hypothetical protein